MAPELFVFIYDIILFAAFAVVTWVVVASWRWRSAPGAKGLMIMMIGMGFWTLSYALHLSAAYRPEPYFWSKLMFLGVVMVPAGFLVWASRYTKYDGWINKLTICLLFIEPVVFNIIVWTDPWHKWFSGSFTTNGILGIAFWIHSFYSYTLLIIGAMMLFFNWLHVRQIYQKQALLILLGLLLAWTANIITIFRLTPYREIDFSPLGFIAAGIIFTYAQLSHQLFDLVPVARNRVFENMPAGVIVLDEQNRILDMNKASEEFLDTTIDKCLGKDVASILPQWQEALSQIAAKKDPRLEFLSKGQDKKIIELSSTILADRKKQIYGRLIILRDISNIKRVEKSLRQSNDNLKQKIAEIETLQIKLKEEAIRDHLTGLYNRRFLQETLNREIAHADRAHVPLSLAMIDLDHFKNINDTYGHALGDLFLTSLASLLQKKTRSTDVCCRYGGEEFVIVMPTASPEEAKQRVDQLREEFSKIKIDTGKDEACMTLSAGVASYPLHGDDDKSLLDAADRALYTAKAKGRNRVVAAK
ncbi:MAG TPA: diguanylate cyclase [Smithellaceae bacterium]|nr:diguanylate cyclase [Smithellaceae bacterium]HRS88597.1 diguanylate cyclase [Smithellaceae bacterium]HRV25877.1 diguanylate cyclase [Smithellaceae bacterium]